MAYLIRWSNQAADELENICNRIALDSDHHARVFAKNIFDVINNAAKFPYSGRIVPEFNLENLREMVTGKYRVVYRILPEYLDIIKIQHGAQKLVISN